MAAEVRIRDAEPAQRAFVRDLSGRVFSRFGDYATSLSGLFALPWVRTVVAATEGQAVGFAMVSLEDRERGEIDLLAIAVLPEWQSKGVGRRLLDHVEASARQWVDRETAGVRLTVSEDNTRARGFFERAGYLPVPGRPGCYPRGQTSLDLRKQL